jgi:hypothetical protein
VEVLLDQIVSRPDLPNLYYSLTNLPAPFIDLRRSLEGERVGAYGTLPGFYAILTDLNAGSVPEEKLKDYVKVYEEISGMRVSAPERILLARNIQGRHELAKKALIDAGRPRDKVEAMPQLQVALLHAFLEHDTVMDNMIVWQSLPYTEFVERMPKLRPQNLAELLLDPNKPAIPLASLITPAVQNVVRARSRNDRKIALLRIIEALRLHAATHDGKLPTSLADIKEVAIPMDPMTGNSFEYQVKDETATLRAPAPGKQAANAGNSLVYELRIRK